MVGRRKEKKKKLDSGKLDTIVTKVHSDVKEREQGYREQSLKLHPWVCGRCGKTFTRENLHLLTVHHIDHNHNNNPPDGSNWENLCIYCHDNEHQKMNEFEAYGDVNSAQQTAAATHNPFADLKAKLEKQEGKE
ncbi:MAG: YajD family HNH nuclease [Gammaproteobacteria bacterium]|nr:YajD family HNH nuclease [Gammaproteobacteria bacterium]